MARPAATPEQRAHKRFLIRDAAAVVSQEVGPAGVTIRQIAERAGVSVGTVYQHFDSLTEIMRSLWTEPVADANRHMRELAEEHPEPVSRARALLEAYVEFALDNVDLYRGVFLFVRPGSAPPPESQVLADVDFYRLLVEAIREAQDSETVVGTDADQLAQMLWAGIHGVLALPINLDSYEFVSTERQAAHMIDALLTSISAVCSGDVA